MASVNATFLVANPVRDILVRTANKVLITLLPPFNASPNALTIMQDLDDLPVVIINDPSNSFQVGF